MLANGKWFEKRALKLYANWLNSVVLYSSETAMENATPMLRQYLDIKKSYPGTILFFRLGDFYEMFNEDAIVGSRELEITLTARQKDSPNPIPMCGVPYHAAANYISKLVRKGYRVAICEQAEPAGKGVKLVKREVVRVITPGTTIDDQLGNSREPVYLAGLCGSGDTFGAAFLELSTGEFQVTQFTGDQAWSKICEQIESFGPMEILYPKQFEGTLAGSFGLLQRDVTRSSPIENRQLNFGDVRGNCALTALDEDQFELDVCLGTITSHFGTIDVDGFGLLGRVEAIRAAGACLGYAKKAQRTSAEHITGLHFYETNEFLILDSVTIRNLEILESRNDTNKHSLLNVIDEAVTGMGSRLLRFWLTRPSIKRSEIQTRQSAVSELMDSILRDKIRFLLKEVSDLERLVGRLNLGSCTPRDLLALRRSLGQGPLMVSELADSRSLLLQVLSENIFELPELVKLIDRAICEEPSLNFSEGGVIKDGFDSELDELRALSRSGKQTIS